MNDLVETGLSFKNELHKKLLLGQSRFVCRYGTLSDGHEKITDAQRYYQSIREMYQLAISIKENKLVLKEAQADYLDAQENYSTMMGSVGSAAEMRLEVKLERTKLKIASTETTIADQMRMLDEYNKVRLELEPIVEEKYPGGIEQAEYDNWMAVAEYRHFKRSLGMNEPMTNLPLPSEDKAKFGHQTGNPDLMAWHIVKNKDEIINHYGGDFKGFLDTQFGEGLKLIKGAK